MFITQKRLEAKIREAKAETDREWEQRMRHDQEERWHSDALGNVERRMSNAFADIDRRLTALENSRRERANEVTCSRY